MFIRTTRIAVLVLTLIAVTGALYAAPAGVVNVNTASVDQLQLLPRVGPTVAARIVEHREQHGAFQAPEDLLLVRGIGEATLERLEPYVTLSGETTLTEKVRSGSKRTSEDG